MVLLYVVASFLSALLVFSVQPLASRMLLPNFGGSAAVWTTSVLFFQVTLLLGYLYTHIATNHLDRRRQVLVHVGLVLLPFIVLPLSVDATPGDGGTVTIVVRLLAGLAVGVGLPFLLVSTSGPLLQRWFSWTDHPRASDPYFLYAASNVGSILGLVSYPFVVEPTLRLAGQAWAWTAGYVGLVALVVACGWFVVRPRLPASFHEPGRSAQQPIDGVHPGVAGDECHHHAPDRVWTWVGLAFVPSSLMLGVTTFLSTDVAAIPLLWVVPLALYLATFVVAFSSVSRMVQRVAMRAFAPVTVLAAAAWLARWSLPVTITLVMMSFGSIAMVFHHRLASGRPSVERLTAFYVWMSVGGALGGLLNGIIAPLMLPGPYEFLVVSVVAALVAGRSASDLYAESPVWWRWSSVVAAAGAAIFLERVVKQGLDTFGLALLGGVIAWWALSKVGQSRVAMVGAVLLLIVPSTSAYLMRADDADRSFFGSYRVDTGAAARSLYSGTTSHGTQLLDPELATRPVGYYDSEGPVGDWLPLDGGNRTIGVVGLGAGTVAAYTREGQLLRYHEIDALVEELARDDFTFLEDSQGDVEVVIGDGRLTLQDVPTGGYDLLMIDAFTSDAIPVHLLTEEAFHVYDRVLADDGVLLVHVSNRHLDLEPVVAAGGEAVGLTAWTRRDPGSGPVRKATIWMALTRSDELPTGHPNGDQWSPPGPERVTWTDDFSNLVQVWR